MPRLDRVIARLFFALLVAGPACASEPAELCQPCLAFDRFDKQIRDGALPKAQARQQFAARIADLDTFLARLTPSAGPADRRVFPLRGYDLVTAGADAAKGYVAAGYDYFDGNRHGGHPSFDLFIVDRNRDSLDDRTGQPVTVVSLTGGIVVAVETAWDAHSPLRGGKYLWVYDSANALLVYYAHNRDILVKVGDPVRPGTPLATVGRSGFNAAKQRSPTHLHLTVLRIRDGRPEPDNSYPQLAGATLSE
jgi:murein DD-endopeptidase MepM/ murein hydrolase activator NlpD